MVILPKPDRRTHENAKDFRPINLTFLMLKVLERLMDIHIRPIVSDNLSTTNAGIHKGSFNRKCRTRGDKSNRTVITSRAVYNDCNRQAQTPQGGVLYPLL